MGLVSTQPLTEMSIRNIPGGKGRPVPKADNLTAICELILTTVWASATCYRNSFTLPILIFKYYSSEFFYCVQIAVCVYLPYRC
jgi:hypothetical protein